MKLCVTIAAVVLSAGMVQAQQPGDTIPKELVQLLLRGPGAYPGDNFDIKIGIPDNFPKELLPAGMTAVVSTVGDRGITVVAEAPRFTLGDLSRHERALQAAGWTNMSSPGMRGLVSSAYQTALTACQGDRYATFGVTERKAGGSYFRVSLTTDPRRGSCRSYPSSSMNFFADVDVPPLMPPTGARTMGSGSSAGSDHFDQHMRMQAAMEPAAIATHYARQLEKAGWTLESAAVAQGVAMTRLTSVSSIKDPIVALIIVTTLPGSRDLDVTLRLLRVDPNRRWPGDPAPGMRGVLGGVVNCCG